MRSRRPNRARLVRSHVQISAGTVKVKRVWRYDRAAKGRNLPGLSNLLETGNCGLCTQEVNIY